MRTCPVCATLVVLALFVTGTASAQADCAILGEYWANVPTSSHNVSIVPTNPPDAQFYVTTINFDSRPGAGKKGLGTNYTVAGFLHYPVFFNTSSNFNASAYIEDAFFRFNGSVYLNTGTNNFLVTHDDGITLLIQGLGLVVNKPDPTPPINTPFFPVAPSNGFYHFTIQYANIDAAPGVLIWTNNGTVVSSYVCPPTVIVPANSGCTATNVALGVPSAACGTATITNNAPPNRTFPLGTNSVIWTFYDTNGNYSTCLQKVIVQGGGPPIFTCPADLTVNADLGSCYASFVGLGTPTVNSCSSVTLSNNAPASFPIGTNLVTWTARAASGSTSTCQQRVVVRDNQSPTIVCPVDITVATDPGTNTASNVNLGVPTFGDNCVAIVTNNAPVRYSLGTNIVTWSVRDASGHTNTCQQRVIIISIQPPQIACPADVTVNAVSGSCFATNVTLGSPIIPYSGCGGVVVKSNAPAQFPIGTNLVTWTVTDACSNSASCLQRVIVRDTQLPTINCPGHLILAADPGQCSKSNVTFTITANTTCAGGATLTQIAGISSGSTFPKGTTTNRFKATDAVGNTNFCSFTVTVVDNESPHITCPPDITVITQPGQPYAANVNLGIPTTTDNCGVPIVSNNAPTIFPVGTNLVTWLVTDTSGNASICQQRVIVSQICFGQLYASPLNNLVVCPCGVATLETTVGSPDPVTFLWRHNGQAIVGATNSSLVLYSLKPADAGTYSVEVRTPCRALTNTAALVLNTAGGANPAVSGNSAGISIVDESYANPYPSKIDVQCVPGIVKKVTVTLTGFEHAFPGDVSVLLAGPDGNGVVLMAYAGGGNSVPGATITFSDAASNYLPDQTMITNGIYLPSDYAGDRFPDLVTATNLAVFKGIDPNGTWQLYVLDDAFGDAGSIASWSLNIEWQDADIELLHPSMTNGFFQAEVSSALNGVSYAIEGSSDLSHWLRLGTNATTSDPDLFIDTHILQFSNRFFRAVKCP